MSHDASDDASDDVKDALDNLDDLSRLAIFPLPDAVLLPGELVPLHIFEPRYRAMVARCLEKKEPLALAQIHPAALLGGAPLVEPVRVFPTIGVGIIEESETLEDGRSNIVVRGVLRARILEELGSDEPYRRVDAIELLDEDEDSDEAEARAGQLGQLLLSFCSALPGRGPQALLEHAAEANGPGEMADLVGAAILHTTRERQQLLEELSVPRRLKLVYDAAAAILAKAMPRPEQMN